MNATMTAEGNGPTTVSQPFASPERTKSTEEPRGHPPRAELRGDLAGIARIGGGQDEPVQLLSNLPLLGHIQHSNE